MGSEEMDISPVSVDAGPVEPPVVTELRTALGPGRVITDPAVTASYSRDMMPLAPSGRPLAVVLPTSTAEVVAIVGICGAAGVPIVPRGAGSGLTGAANALDGAVTMVMTKMNAILEIDEGNRLAVVQPGVVNLTLVAAFGSPEDAGDAVSGAIRAGLVPSLLEIMDATFIRAVEAKTGVSLLGDAPTPALLLGQSDAGGGAGRAEMDRLEQVCPAAGASFAYVTDDLAEGRMLLPARRDVLPSFELLGTWLTDDVSVPRTAIAALISACERISAEVGLTIGVLGHAGDGNMHPTIVYDASDAGQTKAAELAFRRMLDAGRALGGPVTGEHGVGRIKQKFLAAEIGDVGIDVHRRIRNALDPAGLFNPGSMFALSGDGSR